MSRCRPFAAFAAALLLASWPSGAQELTPGEFLRAETSNWEARPSPTAETVPFSLPIDHETDPDPFFRFVVEASVDVQIPDRLDSEPSLVVGADGVERIELDDAFEVEVDYRGELTNRNPPFVNSVIVTSEVFLSESDREFDPRITGCLGDGKLKAGPVASDRRIDFVQRVVCRIQRLTVRRDPSGAIDGLFYIYPHVGYQANNGELSRYRFRGSVEVAYRFADPPAPDPEPDPEPLIPTISQGGVVDAARFQPRLAPGGLGSVFGADLAEGAATATRTPLPTEIDGVRLLIDGAPAPLIFVSPQQINFQAPFETAGKFSVEVQPVLGDQTGEAVGVATSEFAPQIFVDSASGTPAIVRADGSLVSRNRPANDGAILVVFLTGVGGLLNPPETGASSPADPPSESSLPATVTLGGEDLEVFYAGLTPGFVGLAQVNLRVRAPGPGPRVWPLVIRFGGAESLPVDLPVVTDAP